MNGMKEEILQILTDAKATAPVVAQTSSDTKNQAILKVADRVWEHRAAILEANAQDVERARENGQNESRIDRLTLSEDRLRGVLDGLQQVRELTDPVGEVLSSFERPNGLRIEQVRVPIGLIAMIYEARPNVTVDAAGLAIKTGNAVVLRGGTDAYYSNQALVKAMRQGLRDAKLPENAISGVWHRDRGAVDVILQSRGLVDLAIPRGGAGLIERVVTTSTIPVIETGVGNCHIFVDDAADLGKATSIIVNAKTSRPSVCNAAETLLVHRTLAPRWLPDAASSLIAKGVSLRCCPETRSILQSHGFDESHVIPATEIDYETEFLDLVLSIRVVDDVQAAIAHIQSYGTMHSECIVTEDAQHAEEFLTAVDAAVVYHNASTRFTDGFEFGFGAEIGISTQKLHARGPMGLEALTTYKFKVRGSGQIRG